MGRVAAVVILRSLVATCRFVRTTDNVCAVLVTVFEVRLTIISVYARSPVGEADPECVIIHNYLCNLFTRQRSNVMILGDLNAHVGYQDLLPANRVHIRKYLLDPWSNANGDGLKDILQSNDYKLTSSFDSSPSVLGTWSRGNSRLQIDHIIMLIIKL